MHILVDHCLLPLSHWTQTFGHRCRCVQPPWQEPCCCCVPPLQQEEHGQEEGQRHQPHRQGECGICQVPCLWV